MLGGQRAGEPLRQDSVDGLSRQARLEVALRVVMERDDDIVRIVCGLVFLRSLLASFFGEKVRRLAHDRQDIGAFAGELRCAGVAKRVDLGIPFSERG